MTYREYRNQRDREYLAQVLAEHRTVAEAAHAAGVNRSAIYSIAARCGLTLQRRRTNNRGNEAWQRLGS